MFFVSSITGSLVPFDPHTTPISNAVAKLRATSGVAPLTEDRQGQQDGSSSKVTPINNRTHPYHPPVKERKEVVVASDIMSSPVFSLREDSPIEEVQKVFKLRKFRHVPILASSEKLVGIISDRDFITLEHHSEMKGVVNRDCMVTNILTARPQTEIRAIAEVMIGHHIGCLPIIDENNNLVGILTTSDILRAIVNHAPIELWT